MRKQARGRQKRRGGNDGAGLNVVCLVYVKSNLGKSMWRDTGCRLNMNPASCIFIKEVEGKPWLGEEKEQENLSQSQKKEAM